MARSGSNKNGLSYGDKMKDLILGWHRIANPNLTNAEGLPASPFQTDNWTGGTGE